MPPGPFTAHLQARSPKLLEHYAPFAKLLLLAVQALMQQPQYFYEGPAYRWEICVKFSRVI